MNKKRSFTQNIWDIENYFYLNSDVSRIDKIICHYEIFKKTVDIPGSIVECGVFKGLSLIRFLNFRDLLDKKSKTVYGFDIFGKFPKQTIKRDNKFALLHDSKIGVGLNIKKLNNYLKIKKFKNFKLIKGQIEKTLPEILDKKIIKKISFLHLDLDVYEPTKFSLESLYNKVSKGGIILIDDYSRVHGATKATNEFLKRNSKLKIETLKFDKKLKFIVKK
jgi:hypothetical protein